jgi:hypothetical protein
VATPKFPQAERQGDDDTAVMAMRAAGELAGAVVLVSAMALLD